MKKIIKLIFALLFLALVVSLTFTFLNNKNKSNFEIEYESLTNEELSYAVLNSNNELNVKVHDSIYALANYYYVSVLVANDHEFNLNGQTVLLSSIPDYVNAFDITYGVSSFTISFNKTLTNLVKDFYLTCNSSVEIEGLENLTCLDVFKIEVLNHDKSSFSFINFSSAQELKLDESEVLY